VSQVASATHPRQNDSVISRRLIATQKSCASLCSIIADLDPVVASPFLMSSPHMLHFSLTRDFQRYLARQKTIV
jgi:hypothetical protein